MSGFRKQRPKTKEYTKKFATEKYFKLIARHLKKNVTLMKQARKKGRNAFVIQTESDTDSHFRVVSFMAYTLTGDISIAIILSGIY